jgi:hypothetical protein
MLQQQPCCNVKHHYLPISSSGDHRFTIGGKLHGRDRTRVSQQDVQGFIHSDLKNRRNMISASSCH